MTTTARKSRCRKSPPARSKAALVVDESPIRAIACLKKIDDIKRFEETDDCFILGFDPSDNSPIDASSRPHNNDDDDDDLCVLGQKGKIALRDYPHSRHLCLKFPFKTTPRESYCNKCYCYVCDTAAPCMYWTMHCNAESAGHWKDQRRVRRRIY
ncbi:hypothetical protein MtrunA17_Chr3g0128031 [Medicago truncatula]|uniref:Uncharacterized protein n=1 Tax=Medicago truncatula TaxID=3880 RepID=A0A072V0Z2_MEDTR|nr:uncharacterized protein LOC25489793 [Medicago truncatula]KEH35492.1 hypothetical protein MTR_3g092960 [Medicago truncatula]RHN69737.1 hypothetical protein MtrunA17_Chr3g0128031 [Medicago truncatula]